MRAGLADKVDREIATTIEGEQVAVVPSEAGLGVDYDASVAEAGGEESWDPVRLWNYFTGGDDFEAEVTVDDAAYNAYRARLDEQHGTPARDGAIAFDGAEISTTEARTGSALDPSDTLTALREAYLDDAPGTVALEMAEVVPQVDASDVREALDGFASPAVAAPVTLRFEGSDVKVFPADYTAALSLVPTDGELVPTLDGAALSEVVDGLVTAGAPVDASVALVGGRPQVVPARPGVTFDRAQLEAGFLDTVAKPQGQRTLTLDATAAQPDFTTKDARDLQVRERVASFTTYFPYAEYRNINIGRAAEIIDGTLLKPGETFSLNDTVGERTEANGFTKGYVISDGILVQDLGGGVSQMATTLFNAMFFSGLEDVEHKPHSFYIDRYPVGREATVAWGAVDLRFRNDTPYGVLIDTNVTPSTPSSSGVVTATMYSTKYWDITTTTGERYNITQPATRRIDSLTCHPNEGYGGFDIDVVRYFEPVNGNTESREDEVFSTTYTPSDTVICTNPDAVDE
nr:VanW family protein [Nocardioides sp. zg-1308]